MVAGDDSELRLNVYLQERGVASRRKADELIAAGHVSVNGRVVTSMGFRVPKGAKVAVDGKVLSRTLGIVTYLFYKPDLCLTSRHDPQNRRTIFDLPEVQKLPANVQAVGRLDFRSEGLLLLTNDGDLAFALTHPRFSVEKKYSVLLADLVAPDELEKLRKGVMLEDGLARAVSVRAGSKENMGAGKRGQWVEIVVTEGRNRLIRRMLEHLGHKVNRLVRIAIGDVQLPAGMKPGAILAVQGKDLSALNRVRDDFLKARKDGEKSPSSRKAPNRRRGMSDELYAEERVRRSLETSRREAERLEKRRTEKTETRSEKMPRPSGPGRKMEKKVEKPTSKPASRPASRPTSRPTSRPASKPAAKRRVARPS